MKKIFRENPPFSLSMILKSKYAIQTFSLVVVHQSIIASSAFFLTRLIEEFQAGNPYINYLMLYFLSMTIPFVPGCLSFLTLTKWQNVTHKKYIDTVQKRIENRIDLYKNSELRGVVVGLVSRNSFSVLGMVCMYIHSSVTFFLNSFFSIIVIGFILPSSLIGGYLISAVLSVIIILSVSSIISRKSELLEFSTVNYGKELSKMWANLTIGNVQNKNIWNLAIDSSSEDFYRKSANLSALKQGNNYLLGMVALVPTMYLIYGAAKSEDIAPAVVAAIVVNLTRIIHVLNSFGSLVYQIIDLKSVLSRVHVLQSVFSDLEKTASMPRTQPAGKILVNDLELTDFEELYEALGKTTAGRHTITGGNGSGKSTLLHYLKSKYGESCTLLPALVDDLMWATPGHMLSTGQAAISIFNEVITDSEVKILLLDEWDANLDATNKRIIDDKLDVLAEHYLIVEVRHA